MKNNNFTDRLQRLSEKKSIQPDLIFELIEAEQTKKHKKRKISQLQLLENIIKKYL